MATEYRLTRSELAQRYYTCQRCGAQGEVMFGAEGSRGWQRDSLLASPVHQRKDAQAEIGLRTDATRTQALIRCPLCGERSPGALRWAGIRIGFWAVTAALMSVVGGAPLVIGASVCGVMGIWQSWRELGRFKRAGRAVITKLVPGKYHELEHPKPVVHRQLAPPPELPVARVVAAPAPVLHDEPPDPKAPPKFLKP